MIRADTRLSTPPIRTPIDTTRRNFIAQVATVTAAGGALGMTLPLPAPPAVALPAASAQPDPNKVRPELRAAVIAMGAAQDALKVANAALEAGVELVNQWERDNPQPESKRGKKRWMKKYRAYHDEVTQSLWDSVIDAEQAFQGAQKAVAMIKPMDANELHLMAAAAVIYDQVKLTYTGQQALISFGAMVGYWKLNGGVVA